METFDELKMNWNSDKGAAHNPLSKESVDLIVRARIKREKKTVMEYFWSAFFYQNLIYGFGTYFIIKYWGAQEMAWPVLVVVFAYIPFTVLMLKRYKSMANRGVDKNQFNVQAHVTNMYSQLYSFYRFKKKFDWISVPLSCAAIVAITFRVFAAENPFDHLLGAALLFVLWLILFMTAIYFENKKRFVKPLVQMESILNDLKTSD
jgi:hypothetical protein